MTGKKSLQRGKCRDEFFVFAESPAKAKVDYAPEEVQEAKGLYDHSEERPFEENEEDSTQEANCPA